MLEPRPPRNLLAKQPAEVVQGLTELLRCRRTMKDYHCPGWFAYRGCPPEVPYQAMPPELWSFLLEADRAEAVSLAASLPGSDEPS